MIRTLFVCLGNICRSPMAEAIFLQKVRDAGLEAYFEIDSAGTSHWNIGSPPHSGTRRVLIGNGITNYQHSARQLKIGDLQRFDYLLTMDEANFTEVMALSALPKAKVIRLMDYAPHLGVREVPDPYYSGRFDETYLLVEAACAGLLEALREAHHLP